MGVDRMIAANEIRPINLSEFSRVTGILKTEPINLDALKAKYERERTAVLAAKSKLSAANLAERDALLDEAQDRHDSQRKEIVQLVAINKLAVLAAKRASKNPEQLDRAFSTALKFEYNRQKLEILAEEEWSGEWTIKSFDSIVKVLALLGLADMISSKYSYVKANSFNSEIGNVFTRSLEFRELLKFATLKYQKATGSRIVITV
jgi:hypothetical protein